MASNPVERASLFIKHDLVGRYFLYQRFKKYPDLVSDIEKRKEDLQLLIAQAEELAGCGKTSISHLGNV